MGIVIHTDSFRYLWEVLENEEYDFLFRKLVVMDLGCNVGAFTLWIYPRAGMVYSIDADENAINLLKQTARDSGMSEVRPFHAKIDATNSLAGFMSGHSINFIDVLKIDIEGDELDVVEAEDFPASKINTIIGEHHYTGELAERFAARLGELHYNYMELPNNHFVARRFA